ncbi:MAG: FAD-dependent oxidoreductase [Candidatus Nomurabacteria bacterium]|jgi:thioredoxin reductase (NADPH)|nr:FAD-dependent oxidoreductase [Candidatus Nomurabacteria bacterium]
MLDLIIIGSGPAALSAAIYVAREHMETVVFERKTVGGLLAGIDKIENYTGFVAGSGAELAKVMRTQAEHFGAKIKYGEVTEVKKRGEVFELTVDGESVKARAVLVATGSEPAKLGIDGEDLKGISYCATCDGAFFDGKTVAVIGGANSAVQEALFLLKFVKKVFLISHSAIKSSETLKKQLKEAVKAQKIEVLENIEPKRFVSDGEMTTEKQRAQAKTATNVEHKPCVARVIVEDKGKEREVKIDGAFIFVGHRPATTFLAGTDVELSEKGAIVTDGNLMTKVAGLFAAGSVRAGAVDQVITVAGDGAAAAVSIRKYLQK